VTGTAGVNCKPIRHDIASSRAFPAARFLFTPCHLLQAFVDVGKERGAADLHPERPLDACQPRSLSMAADV
jgi:hypothetical protein